MDAESFEEEFNTIDSLESDHEEPKPSSQIGNSDVIHLPEKGNSPNKGVTNSNSNAKSPKSSPGSSRSSSPRTSVVLSPPLGTHFFLHTILILSMPITISPPSPPSFRHRPYCNHISHSHTKPPLPLTSHRSHYPYFPYPAPILLSFLPTHPDLMQSCALKSPRVLTPQGLIAVAGHSIPEINGVKRCSAQPL